MYVYVYTRTHTALVHAHVGIWVGGGRSCEAALGAVALCGACGSGGRLRVRCSGCAARLHAECAPRAARASRRWLCERCSAPTRGNRSVELHSSIRPRFVTLADLFHYLNVFYVKYDMYV